MLTRWRRERDFFIFLVLAGLLAGIFFDVGAWIAVAVLAVYSGWLLLRLRDLVRWVDSSATIDVPTSTGIWGELFDSLYYKTKEAREAKDALERSVKRTRDSLNAIQEAVIFTNEDGLILWFNSGACSLMGLKQDIDRYQPVTNLIRDPAFVRYSNSGNYDKPVEFFSPKNPKIRIEAKATVFGERNERLVICRDITRLHNLQQIRKDFVANVSHELRTPLTVLKGYLETFLGALNLENQKGLHRGLIQMEMQTNRMEMLVSDLLLLSNLETETISKPEHVNVGSMLQAIFDDAQVHNDEKQHKITLDADFSLGLTGVEKELRSAFSNLVLNAVKYTPEGGDINIRWWADKQGAHFSVKDSGIGIDSIHIPRLTERFYRADPSRHSKTGGTGLGLAIVKHVLMHHNAQLDITSELNVGSTFTCHFPTLRIQRNEPADVSMPLEHSH